MKTFRPLIIAISFMAALILSACTGSVSPQAGWPGLIADQNTAYLAHGSFVYAVNLADHSQKWRFPTSANPNISFYSAPALTPDGKQLIVGGYDSLLYSLDPATGKENWHFTAKGRFIGGPLVADQTIYAPSADNNLYALDFSGKPVSGFTFHADGPLWSTPATDGKCGCLYVSSMDHNVYSIDMKTGNVNWRRDLGSAVIGTPALSTDGGTLYIGNFNSQLFTLDAKNRGAVIGNPVSLKGWVWSGPVLKGDTLYFGDSTGNFYSLKAGSNTFNSIQPDNSIVSAPLVTDQAVYFTVEAGQIFAVDQNLKALWNPTIGGTMYTSPVSAGDLILVSPVGIDAVLVALNSSGSQQWQFIPPK